MRELKENESKQLQFKGGAGQKGKFLQMLLKG